MSYSLLSISDSFCDRKGSCAGKSESLWINDRIDPHSLLYLTSCQLFALRLNTKWYPAHLW